MSGFLCIKQFIFERSLSTSLFLQQIPFSAQDAQVAPGNLGFKIATSAYSMAKYKIIAQNEAQLEFASKSFVS